jgi:hypothetical protein
MARRWCSGSFRLRCVFAPFQPLLSGQLLLRRYRARRAGRDRPVPGGISLVLDEVSACFRRLRPPVTTALRHCHQASHLQSHRCCLIGRVGHYLSGTAIHDPFQNFKLACVNGPRGARGANESGQTGRFRAGNRSFDRKVSDLVG